MTYSLANTPNYRTQDAARFLIVQAMSSAERVQIYVAGVLTETQTPTGTGVTFYIPHLSNGEYIRLLAVDAADEDTDFFADAYPNDLGGRITARTPTVCGLFAGELWTIYIDDALDYERDIWPHADSPSSQIGGRGTFRGLARGIELYGSGRGNWRGLQRGYEPVTLYHASTLKSPGDYELAVTFTDMAENETTQNEQDVIHATYPEPPSDMTVSSFTIGTGALAFTFTASDDLD